MENEERLIAVGGAIKALDDSGRVGGYLVVFGDEHTRDLQGEYFTPDTDLALDWFDRRPALYQHGLDATLGCKRVGTIDTVKVDAVGVWAEAQLDMHDEYVQKVKELVRRGILSWSSGSVPHLVETEAGKIKRWPIVEGSLTPTPAEPRGTNIMPLKAYLEWVIPAAAEGAPEAAIEPATVKEPPMANKADGVEITIETEPSEPENDIMNMEEIVMAVLQAVMGQGVNLSEEQQAAIVQQVIAAQPPEAVAAVVTDEQKAADIAQQLTPIVAKAAADYVAAQQARETALKGAINGAVKNVIGEAKPAAKGGGFSLPREDARIEVSTKYQGLSALDMSYLAELRKGMKSGWVAEPAFYRELAHKAQKDIDGGKLAASPSTANAIKSVLRDEWALKSNELNHSTQSSYGDEWVPDLWSGDLWRRARIDNVVLPQFRSFEMPSNPYELPIEGGDPTVSYVAETTAESELLISGSGAAIPDSKIGSGKVQISAKKFALRTGFSSELEEDSIIPVLSIYREQADRAIMNSIDFVLLNGDTTTDATGNINSDDGAPAAGSRYLAFDGLLHSALVEDTTRALDASGVAPTLQLIRQARFKLPYAYALRTGDLAYFVGGEVAHKLLNINEFLTVDKYGQNATVLNGEVGRIDNSPVLTTAELAAAEADGKINTASPSSTLYGRLLCVYKPNWVVGYRRQVRVSVDFIPYLDAYQMTATVRLGFAHFDNDSAAVLYDLAI